MSYFMVVSGAKPDLSKIRGITFNLTPLTIERAYIQDSIRAHFPHFEEAKSWSISDASQTMRMIPKVYEELAMGGKSLSTVWIDLVTTCASAGCKIFVWWTDALDGDGFQKNMKKAADVNDLHKIIMAQQGKDGNVCAYLEPLRKPQTKDKGVKSVGVNKRS